MPFDFWKRWRKQEQPEREPDPPPRDLRPLIANSTRSALHLVPEEAAEPTSWFCIASDADDHHGLSLLACIDLAEVQIASRIEWLPAIGSLSFYYEIEEQPWVPKPSEFEVVWHPQKPRPQGPVKGISFRSIVTYPGLSELGMTLTSAEHLIYSELCESVFGGLPQHQIDGWSQPIQDSLECPAGSRLLLQLDSDDSLGWMWSDVGRLYFMIKESDARQRDFSKAWCILQCH